jgi:hypothetical protein
MYTVGETACGKGGGGGGGDVPPVYYTPRCCDNCKTSVDVTAPRYEGKNKFD